MLRTSAYICAGQTRASAAPLLRCMLRGSGSVGACPVGLAPRRALGKRTRKLLRSVTSAGQEGATGLGASRARFALVGLEQVGAARRDGRSCRARSLRRDGRSCRARSLRRGGRSVRVLLSPPQPARRQVKGNGNGVSSENRAQARAPPPPPHPPHRPEAVAEGRATGRGLPCAFRRRLRACLGGGGGGAHHWTERLLPRGFRGGLSRTSPEAVVAAASAGDAALYRFSASRREEPLMPRPCANTSRRAVVKPKGLLSSTPAPEMLRTVPRRCGCWRGFRP